MLSELATTVPGLSGKSKADFSDGNARFASYRNIFANPSLDLNAPDFVKVEEGEQQNCVQRGDILITGSSESLEDVGMSSVVTTDPQEPIYLNSFCFIVRLNQNNLLEPDFAKHLFRSEAIRKQIRRTASGVTRINISKPRFMKVSIPVPPLEVQRAIVEVLDKLVMLEVELKAELEARKRQYEYYEMVLTDPFNTQGKLKEGWQAARIGDLCRIEKGKTPIQKAIPGQYPLVATTQERQSSVDYQFDAEAVCVPLISSRGHGVASITRIYYQSGKFALGNILCAVIPDDPSLVSAKFLRYFLYSRKDFLLVPLMRGGANVSLTIDSLKTVKIQFPSLAEQNRVVKILDSFHALNSDPSSGLPAEMSARRKQYEYYRDQLLTFKELES